MEPRKRLAYYRSELRRLDLEERARNLVPAESVRATLSEMFCHWAMFLETLPDAIERYAGMTGEQVECAHALIRAERQRLYEQVTSPREIAESGNAQRCTKPGLVAE